MEERCMKRLYIGGLNQTISEKDIKDRFGKFGEVSDVEIIQRQDGTGVPVKTFGYININISEASLKKCMTVLNKSRWKGGMLQIEMAKESFLHRLALEREKNAEKPHTPQVGEKERLMESFKTAGVENFHMKAAVPGTEIPGHKDWVVSKYGRVLPVLHLKSQSKKKIFKYDPSKHCHNIKRLETEITAPTPVSKLTWEILDADNEITKKRRGEFPPWKAPPAKIKKSSVAEIMLKTYSTTAQDWQNREPGELGERNWAKHNGNISALAEKPEKNGSLAAIKQNHPLTLKKTHQPVNTYDSEIDSGDEIEMLVALENARDVKLHVDDEDNLEVVGDDFVVAPNVLWTLETQSKKQDCLLKRSEDPDAEQGYDSADTDEILSHCKSAQSVANTTQKSVSNGLNDNPNVNKLDSQASKRKGKDGSEVPPSDSTDDCEGGSSEDRSDQSDDSDYIATMTNCCRLELSLADLEKLTKEAADSDEENLEGVRLPAVPPQSSGVAVKKTKTPGNTPEEILADILGGQSSDDEKCDRGKKKKKKKTSSPRLPAFTGTKSLTDVTRGIGPSSEKFKREGRSGRAESNSKVTAEPTPTSGAHALEGKASRLESRPGQLRNDVVECRPLLREDEVAQQTHCGEPDGDSDGSEDERAKRVGKGPNSVVKSAAEIRRAATTGPGCQHDGLQMLSAASGTSGKGSKSSREKVNEKSVSEKPLCCSERSEAKKNVSQEFVTKDTAERQQGDNQKRLAALELRQKEAEQQKKLIQDALSKLDTPRPSAGKHVVFDSDDGHEDSSDTDVHAPRKTLFQESSKSSEDSAGETVLERATKADSTVKGIPKEGVSKLFLSSEDEEDNEDNDNDGHRFQIKPQFEGKSGQKLMELQSRFGTDERFRMDSRFLESDEETDGEDDKVSCSALEVQLKDEKKKNLDILQNLLHIDIHSSDTSKETVKGRIFKDVTALHYDPTKEEHSAFEMKREDPKKESKATRRKKREAAEKLPEVSKDIFYNVAVDLKEAFGTAKESGEKKQCVAWDEEEEMEEGKDSQTGDDCAALEFSVTPKVEEESSGFKFSFFGEEFQDSTVKDDYKVEILKGAKVSWQTDPRFQDSSSDEEYEEEEEQPENMPLQANEDTVKSKKTFFFFFQGDSRLNEGPKMFCRTGKLEDQQAKWEEMRSLLTEEYRKRHKNAKRRVNISLRS